MAIVVAMFALLMATPPGRPMCNQSTLCFDFIRRWSAQLFPQPQRAAAQRSTPARSCPGSTSRSARTTRTSSPRRSSATTTAAGACSRKSRRSTRDCVPRLRDVPPPRLRRAQPRRRLLPRPLRRLPAVRLRGSYRARRSTDWCPSSTTRRGSDLEGQAGPQLRQEADLHDVLAGAQADPTVKAGGGARARIARRC